MKNNYEVRGEITAIFLTRKDGTVIETLISTPDFEKVNSFPGTWIASKQRVGFYVAGGLNKKTVYLHRWIFDSPKGFIIDHINHDTLNNTRKNLRIVTQYENMQNRSGAQRNSSSGYRGVSWDKALNKWRVQVNTKVNGKRVRYHIGYFTDKEEARNAGIQARSVIFPNSMEIF